MSAWRERNETEHQKIRAALGNDPAALWIDAICSLDFATAERLCASQPGLTALLGDICRGAGLPEDQRSETDTLWHSHLARFGFRIRPGEQQPPTQGPALPPFELLFLAQRRRSPAPSSLEAISLSRRPLLERFAHGRGSEALPGLLKLLLKHGDLDNLWHFADRAGFDIRPLLADLIDYPASAYAVFAQDGASALRALDEFERAGLLINEAGDPRKHQINLSDLVKCALPNCIRHVRAKGYGLPTPVFTRRKERHEFHLAAELLWGKAMDLQEQDPGSAREHADRIADAMRFIRDQAGLDLDHGLPYLFEELLFAFEPPLPNALPNLKILLDALARAGFSPAASKAHLNALANKFLQNMPTYCAGHESAFGDFLDILTETGADLRPCPAAIWAQLSVFSGAEGAASIETLAQMLEQRGLPLPRAAPGAPIEEHPAALALLRQRPHAFQIFAKRGATLAWTDPKSGKSSLNLAADFGTGKDAQAAMAILLADKDCIARLNAPADLGGKTGAGMTPLMQTARDLNAPLAKLLLQAGADPNLRDKAQNTALHHAGRKFGAKAHKKAAEIVEMLLLAGADPAASNADGKTPAQQFASKAPIAALEKLLALRPEDVGSSTESSKRAMSELAARGHEAMSAAERSLLETGVQKPRDPDDNQDTKKGSGKASPQRKSL